MVSELEPASQQGVYLSCLVKHIFTSCFMMSTELLRKHDIAKTLSKY